MTETETTPVGPFARGKAIGANLFSFIFFGTLGLLFGILSFVVGAVIEIIKVVTAKQFIIGVFQTAVNALIFMVLFNFAAVAVFPFFVPATYLQAFALVVIFNIILRTSPPPQEKKLDDLALLQFLLATGGGRGPGGGPGATPPSPVRNDPAARPTSGPQRPVSSAPGR